jgi:hypothetical protein
MPSAGSSSSLADEIEAGAATQTCPHCGALNVADALFCEECGYDFTTGTPPLGSEPEDEGLDGLLVEPVSTELEGLAAVTADAPGGEAPMGGERVVDEAQDLDAELERPVVDEPEAGQPTVATSDTPGTQAAPVEPEVDEPATEEPTADEPAVEDLPAEEPADPYLAAAPDHDPQPAPGVPTPGASKGRHTPPSRALSDAWVVEMWVDPDWYAVQQTEEACPSAGVPDVVLLTRSAALVGRPSGSLGVRPEVDAGADSAVSRRHAQLTSDGRRWWIEDLGSSNGTFVGRVAEPMPSTPIPQGQRVEIDRDDRIYVGAWTRLVLRQATEAEKRGEG